MTQLAPGALAIAFIGLLEALSIAKAIAYQSGQKIDYNRQIIAEGLANLTGGFFQAVPGSGSVTRSPINYQAGAETRFSGVIASIGVADRRAVVRAATALHAAGRAGRTAADHRRTTDRHQAVELRHQGVPLRRGAGHHHRARRRARSTWTPRCSSASHCRSCCSCHGRPSSRPGNWWSRPNGWSASGCRAIRPIHRRSSMTSRASCSSVPHPNSKNYLEALGERIKRRRHQIPRAAGQAGAPPGRRRHPADREIRSGGNRPRRNRPARGRAGRPVDTVDERRVRQVVPVRARLPRGGRGILGDAEGGPLRPRTAWLRRIRRRRSRRWPSAPTEMPSTTTTWSDTSRDRQTYSRPMALDICATTATAGT